ncbi:MAG: biopolymer transporter ExbD [Deltaproteobacteria bacterium]|nr:biopolymer transporter ExbD [Deltaproteobacteria bacterium]MBI2501286.1 biopolymer transporter ExbD [Deltaproteobacteria bacterium]MBI4197009.1 biopolymer transporter ExbD [Deltaproteobacteria bacterium]
MAFLKKRVEEEVGFNVTPLVDVMFNLLIFIIITAQYSNIQSLKVNLPKAQSGTTMEKEEETIVVTLTKEGQVHLNDEKIPLDDLKPRLVSLSARENPPRVILQADRDSTTGGLVKVMDLASQAGLKKISIETKK